MNPIETVALSPEDEARANLYGLLARLLYAGPDAALLRALAQSGGMLAGDQALPVAWRELCAAAGEADADACRIEYDTVFVGVGKAPVTPYFTHYLTPIGQERILVELRDALGGLGLARSASAVEPEDHVAALLEVMRRLVTRGGEDAAFAEQKTFFLRFLAPAYVGFCLSSNEVQISRFYAAVTELLGAFLAAESLQFEMN